MILLIAIVIGAIVGGAASGEGGALAGALFGWLILRSLRQQAFGPWLLTAVGLGIAAYGLYSFARARHARV